MSDKDLPRTFQYLSPIWDRDKKGLISEKDIDVSVKRLLKARFELGEMDDPDKVEWTKIPYSVVCSAEHDSLSLDIARKSMTLLLNKNNYPIASQNHLR